MKSKTKRYGVVSLAVFLILTSFGCSVFISTPRVTHIQVQGLEDQLWEYTVTLDDSAESNLNIDLSDRYSLQFDFEWLWNTEEPTDLYFDLSEEFGDSSMVPWMLCKYRF